MATHATTKTIVHTEDAVPPLPVFCKSWFKQLLSGSRGRSPCDRCPEKAATVANGIVYCSGSIGCDHQLNVVPGGVSPQTVSWHLQACTCALENLSKVLAAAGSGLEHILKVNVYLANMPRDFATMNEAYIKVGIIKFCIF
ncbi:endoribonuclease l-PSP domain-containing protein [Rhizoctonia solani AG-1 IA]|uniref:Endoribonuclease l-PSP domain-containing protein n=1 Tax=Thanatephorus cucumeris (strain AG1-IA) TaxID=983506 RepID=L8WKU8_THACA|nr:endoribonuclease l-PSP domain-containing protein [Rhizoctonia solani AG-1 IA]